MMYTLGELMVGVIEAVAFFMILDSVFEKRDCLPKAVYGLVVVILAAVIDMSFYMLFGTLENSLIMYCTAFALSFVYRGDIKTRIAIPLIVLVLIALIELPILYLTTCLFDVTVETVIGNKSLWLLGAIFSKVILLIVANVLRVHIRNRILLMRTSYWLLFMVVFAPALTTSFLLFNLTYNIDDKFIIDLSVLSAMGLMAGAFAAMFLYEHLSRQSEIVNRERQYEQQIKSQSKHLDEILVMQKQLKSFRHDMENHWIALKGYFENGDYDNGIRYIKKINGSLEAIDTIDTGNVALDAIISSKKALADEKNIRFEFTVQVPEQLPIEAADICVILGNALDNAVEACERIKDGDKYIRISIIYEGDSILCKIENSAPKAKKISLKTSKADRDNHGFGLENIKQALSKYNHLLKIDTEESAFVLSFIIFNK